MLGPGQMLGSRGGPRGPRGSQGQAARTGMQRPSPGGQVTSSDHMRSPRRGWPWTLPHQPLLSPLLGPWGRGGAHHRPLRASSERHSERKCQVHGRMPTAAPCDCWDPRNRATAAVGTRPLSHPHYRRPSVCTLPGAAPFLMGSLWSLRLPQPQGHFLDGLTSLAPLGERRHPSSTSLLSSLPVLGLSPGL